MLGYSTDKGKLIKKKKPNLLTLKKFNTARDCNKDSVLNDRFDNKAISTRRIVSNKNNLLLSYTKFGTIHLKSVTLNNNRIQKIQQFNSTRVKPKPVCRSRNIRSLSTYNNPSQSTAFTKDLMIPNTRSQLNAINSYKKIYKYSFITKKEKLYEPNAECDSDAHEEEKKELMIQLLSEKYSFIQTQLSQYDQNLHLIKDMFRYPKLEFKKRRQNEIMLQKYKKKYLIEQKEIN